MDNPAERSATRMSYYIYAFVPTSTTPLAGLTTVAGQTLEKIMLLDMAVLCEKLDRQVFQSELETEGNNPAWLSEKAVLHDAIITAHLPQGVLPLRFGTILESKAAVLNLLEQNQQLKARLLALQGKSEFAVRIWADKTVLTPRLIASDENLDDLSVQFDSVTGGKAYMLKKRLQDGVDRLFAQQIPTFRSIAFGQLADLVNQLVPFTRTPKGTTERVGILEAAVLLDAREYALLPAELESWLDRYGFAVEMTGPFAPYNFVQDAEE